MTSEIKTEIKNTINTYAINHSAWWRHHQMGTFSALLTLCEFLSQRPVTRSFDVFLDPRLNKRLSEHSRRRRFETPSRSLWRHCNGKKQYIRSILWRAQYHATWKRKLPHKCMHNPLALILSGQHGCHFTDDILKYIFLQAITWTSADPVHRHI